MCVVKVTQQTRVHHLQRTRVVEIYRYNQTIKYIYKHEKAVSRMPSVQLSKLVTTCGVVFTKFLN